MANVSGVQRDQSRGPPGQGHEFDFEPVWLVDVDYCAEIALPEAVLR